MVKTQEDYVNQMRDDLGRQARRISELELQLADAINGHLPEDQHLDPDGIWVEAMVYAKTKEPRVALRWFTHLAHLSEAQARHLALNILDCIEAAKTDSYLYKFFGELVGVDERKIAQLILQFRNFRQDEAEKGKSDDQ